MNQHLKERILRKLETLSDERAYQVLDFIEFLESKYAARQSPDNLFTRFADGIEDKLRAGKVSTAAIAETMSLMNKAMGVLGGVAAAGKSVASDIVATAREAGKQVSGITAMAGRPGGASENGAPAAQQGSESSSGTSQADGSTIPPRGATGSGEPQSGDGSQRER